MSGAREAGPLGAFSEATRAWFADALGAPTEVQVRAWAAIAAGENALVIAPTGSGKTLAAFLWAIDALMAEKARVAEAGKKWVSGVRVLYVSPLKALGADVDRNLQGPLAAISELMATQAGRDGAKPPEVRTAMRTGDTTPDERRKIARNPPDILITTPESLYLMLTSAARDVLRCVETVIVDEVHALAGDKRGAHLSLSLERLDDLLDAPAQRIGLSATVRPRDEVARFLGGAHPVTVVATEAPPALDLSVRVPVSDMTAVPAFGGFRGAGDGTRERGSGPRRAPIEQAWKSDRALRAVMRDEAAPAHPDSRMGTASIWPHIEAAILDEVLAHTSTIVFVNSRGLCEKLTARLNELYAKRLGLDAPHAETAGYWSGAGSADERPGAAFRSDIGSTTALVTEPAVLIAKAHHGSVSKEKRLQVERELKAGELPCVVATSSLELGIDMGSIDLVLQVAAPFSVASGLQRVGRANHQVGGRSRGIIYPRTRVELIDCAATAEGMEAGALESASLVRNALDVLAQQTVAAVAMVPDGLPADEWLACVRRSACYADLGRRSFEGVLDLLAGRYSSGDVAEFAPRILWDRETGLLKPRPGSQRLAVTAAGTIPDRGMFSVVLPEGDARQGRRRVGELDEEMVMESRVGDIIALGTSTWRIKEIGADRVTVEPAPGRSARLPFWHGEAVGRSYETGRARGAFVRALDGGVADASEDARDGETALAPALRERLVSDGLDENALRNLADLIAAQRECTGAVPTDRVLVVEQCADEAGDWRVILHSPFGRRVHEPWALAVAHRITTERGWDPQANASDDGILLRVPLSEAALPGAELFMFDPDELEAIVRERVGYTALFAARFRECAARALLMSPTAPGKRAPLWQQRLKGGQLLEAARNEEDFPIIAEALRECLQDVFDLPALREVMTGLSSGTIRTHVAQTAIPSPFACPLIFGYVGEHLYEGDLPHAERQASLLAVDPALLTELLGEGAVEEVLDPVVVEQVVAELQRVADGWKARDAEGLSDMLRELGPLTVEEAAARFCGAGEEGGGELPASTDSAADRRAARLREVEALLAGLASDHRAFPAVIAGAERWASADDAARLKAVLGVGVPPWADVSAKLRNPLDGLAARFARTHGIFAAGEVAESLGLGERLIGDALGRLAAEGRLTRLGADRWADANVLRRLRTRSLARAREAVKPVSCAAFARYLLRRQAIAVPGEPALRGIDGVADVIAQFEGAFFSMEQWEREIFPARVPDFKPAMLDELVAAGEVVWEADGRAPRAASAPAARRPSGKSDEKASVLRVAFYPTDSPVAPFPWDPDFGPAEVAVGEPGAAQADCPTALKAVRHVLAERGPLPFRSLVDAVAALCAPASVTDRDVAEALEELVRRGEATNDGLAFPRAGGLAAPVAVGVPSAGQTPPPSRRRASSRRGRSLHSEMRQQARAAVVARQGAASAFDAALSGRWMLLAPSEASSTAQAVALVESLLDRYGVISRDVALMAGIPGGLSSIYPALRAMEDAGELTRGMFVEGLGPAQFAARETVEALRCEMPSREAVALNADDPVCLWGAGLPWPEIAWDAAGGATPVDAALVGAKPSRREGAVVVAVDGAPALWAAPRLKSLIAFSDDEAVLACAVEALAGFIRASLKREGSAASRRKLVVEYFNGRDVLDTPVAALLQAQGFARLPNGMRFYASPF